MPHISRLGHQNVYILGSLTSTRSHTHGAMSLCYTLLTDPCLTTTDPRGGVGEAGKMGYLERSCDRYLPAGMETFLNFRDDIASLCVLIRADTMGFPSGSLKLSKVSLLQIPSTST